MYERSSIIAAMIIA